MGRNNQGNSGEKFQKGYRPLNEGYAPLEKRGYVSSTVSPALPQAPEGGTGQSPAAPGTGTAPTATKTSAD